MFYFLKVIGPLSLILLSVAGVSYSDNGFTKRTRIMVRSAMSLGVVYFLSKVFPLLLIIIFEILHQLGV